MKKARFLSLALVLIMMLSLFSGCGGSSDSSSSSAATTTAGGATEATTTAGGDATTTAGASDASGSISLGIWPEDTMTDEIKLHEGFVKTFKEKHPNVEVVPAFYKYAPETFTPRAQAGNLPTIYDTWFTEPQKIIRNGFARDITDILKERGWYDMISPDIKDLLSDADGKIYGVPRDAYPLGIMINLDVFEKAGLLNEDGTAKYPKTWTEFAETAKTITEKTDAAGFCMLAKNEQGGWHWSNVAWAFGATQLCKDNGDGTFTSQLDSPEAIKAMEFWKSLKWDYNALTANPMDEEWPTGFTALGTAAAGMYIAAVDAVMQPTYTNGLPVDKLSLVPMPAGDGGQYSLFGGTPYMFSPKATDEEVNLCLDYLEIMGKGPFANETAIKGMEEDAQYRKDNGIPVIQRFPCWESEELAKAEADIISKYQNVDSKLYDDYFEITKKPGNLHVEEPGNTQQMYSTLNEVIQACLTDKDADVAALMKKANENYQTLLDQG